MISGSNVKKSPFLIRKIPVCISQSSLSVTLTSQFGLPSCEMRPAERYPVGSTESHMGDPAMEALTGKRLQRPILCGVSLGYRSCVKGHC